MTLGLTILIWMLVIAIAIVFLFYGLAFLITIILSIKGEKDFKKKKVENHKEFERFRKQNEERMEQFRKEHSHITNELDKHS